jgi:NADPH2:quinone reductase
LTRPGLGAYATELGEYHQRADAVLGAVTDAVIKPAAWNVFALADAAAAHAALESGKSGGTILLKP